MTKHQKHLPKIYSLEYLATTELSEEELYELFDKEALFYSLIKEMYVYTGEYTAIRGIYEHIHENKNWVNSRHFKTLHDQQEFVNKAIKAIENIYYYSHFMAKRWVDDFMFHYGFPIHKNR